MTIVKMTGRCRSCAMLPLASTRLATTSALARRAPRPCTTRSIPPHRRPSPGPGMTTARRMTSLVPACSTCRPRGTLRTRRGFPVSQLRPVPNRHQLVIRRCAHPWAPAEHAAACGLHIAARPNVNGDLLKSTCDAIITFLCMGSQTSLRSLYRPSCGCRPEALDITAPPAPGSEAVIATTSACAVAPNNVLRRPHVECFDVVDETRSRATIATWNVPPNGSNQILRPQFMFMTGLPTLEGHTLVRYI